MKYFLIILLFVTPYCALAEALLPSYCNSEAVKTIDRPLFPTKNSPTFKFRFGKSVRDDADAPIIIFVPGGPGQTSMEMAVSYPSEFAIVRTDPRGVGCNKNPKLTSESLSSDQIANDIVAIVKELKPKKYFIHAISYGTIPATMAAAKIQNANLPLPEGVILEGTVGRAFLKDEYYQGILSAWKNLKAKLPRDVVAQLNSGHIPFGLSSSEWAAGLSGILPFGILSNEQNFAFDQLLMLKSSATAEDRELLEKRLRLQVKPPTIEKTLVYKTITCREIVPDVRDVKFDYDFKNGDLVISDLKLCQGIKFDKAYDSRKYQSKIPIYYFSGGLDPITPPAQAKFHFDGQIGPRTFISVPRGGHAALSVNLSDCSENIWNSLLNRKLGSLKQALGSCYFARELRMEEK